MEIRIVLELDRISLVQEVREVVDTLENGSQFLIEFRKTAIFIRIFFKLEESLEQLNLHLEKWGIGPDKCTILPHADKPRKAGIEKLKG